jgi:hypothetical protein
MKRATKKHAKPKYRWPWSYHGDRQPVDANTRSEARSLMKRQLGLGPAHRLPLAVTIGEAVKLS